MQQRKLILFLIILFVLSSAYLFYTAKNYNDPNYQKNWWALYFENPKSDDLSFVIENHSDNTDFYYMVLSGIDKIEEKNIQINKGEIKKIKLENISLVGNKKIIVQVISNNEKKEIYKNL